MALTFGQYLEKLERSGPENWDNLCFLSAGSEEELAGVVSKAYPGRRGNFFYNSPGAAANMTDAKHWNLTFEGRHLSGFIVLTNSSDASGLPEDLRFSTMKAYLSSFMKAVASSSVEFIYTGRLLGIYPKNCELPAEMVVAVHKPLKAA